MPVPIPVTMRPTIRWARVKALHCKVAPMMMMVAASHIARRRPSFCPMKKLTRGPTSEAASNISWTALASTSCQSPQIVRAHDEACQRGRRMIKLSQPILIFQDTAKDSLAPRYMSAARKMLVRQSASSVPDRSQRAERTVSMRRLWQPGGADRFQTNSSCWQLVYCSCVI